MLAAAGFSLDADTASLIAARARLSAENKALRRTSALALAQLRALDKAGRELQCPLTMDIVRDPVVSRYGHVFEREQIEHYVKETGLCPMTRQPLRLEDLFRDRALQTIAAAWREARRVAERGGKRS